MIAPFGGFINGIAFNRPVAAIRCSHPAALRRSERSRRCRRAPTRRRNGTITVGQEAFNILNAQFTAGLLAPVETALGQGLGLSSVNLTLGYYGNVGVTATRLLGQDRKRDLCDDLRAPADPVVRRQIRSERVHVGDAQLFLPDRTNQALRAAGQRASAPRTNSCSASRCSATAASASRSRRISV